MINVNLETKESRRRELLNKKGGKFKTFDGSISIGKRKKDF